MDYFNLGFPKSGTSSLQHFFEQLKIPSSHWTVDKSESGAAKKYKYVGQAIYANYMSGKKIFAGFSDTKAITQADVCLPSQGINFWPQLDESIRAKLLQQYPSTKLILLKRDPRSIVSSIKCWNDMFFRFVVSDIPGFPAWRGFKDNELLTWVEGHYQLIESQYSELDNFFSFELEDSSSFDLFLQFSGLGDDAKRAGISKWPHVNSHENGVEFDSSLYWLASDFSAEVKRGRKLQLEIEELRIKSEDENKNLQKAVQDLKQQVSAKGAELEKERKERAARAERVKALEGELAGVKVERDARAKEKGEAQKAVEELRQQVSAGAERVKALEGELAGVKVERDARAKEKGEAQKVVEELKQQVSAKGAELEKEKGEAQKAVEELKQQVSAKAAELEKERRERAAGEERVKALEGQLAGVKGERDACVKEKDAAREEADLTLLQLHQVQEELEHYFQLSRRQATMLSSSEDLFKRAYALTSKMTK